MISEPKPEPAKFQVNQPTPKPVPVQTAPKPEKTKPQNTMPVSSSTLSLLKDMLQNKAQANNVPRNDANRFMGQPICTPPGYASMYL